MRGIKWQLLISLLLASVCALSQDQSLNSTTTCVEKSGKPCPEWVHKLVGQYPPVALPSREMSESIQHARMFTMGDGEHRLHMTRTTRIIDVAAWGAAWGCTVAAVRNPRSKEEAHSEYPAMVFLTGFGELMGNTVMPVFSVAPASYATFHYCRAALR